MSWSGFSKDEVLAIHDASLKKFGGLSGIRDLGLLDSALAQPFQTFDGVELYPSDVEKAARYAYGICKNHPFIDGNKRTATACMATFLRMKGYTFKPDPNDLLEIMMKLAAGLLSYNELISWIKNQL
ncbi:type II toxin-antitoxin system death-on-curing family toxin [Olsenella sp. Marseille-QA0557]|uniref:type II toxin-antitoxin system death-on-curing family toxin n=1 Tax=Olsenella sp. Marseille-QA0557 TaxID=3378782 RepID=UPI003D0AE3DE